MGWESPVAAAFQAGNTIILNEQGLFVYNGTPAADNLLFSVSETAFDDDYGNQVLEGAAWYWNISGGVYYAVRLINDGIGASYSTSGQSGWAPVGLLQFLYDSGLTQLLFNGFNAIQLAAGNTMQITGSPVKIIGSPVELTGAINGSLTALEPGTASTPETWHNGTLKNGWISASGFEPFGYMLNTDGNVLIKGVISATSATSSTFFTLPSGYIPDNSQGYAVGATGHVPAGKVSGVSCDTSGNLTINNAATPPDTDSYFINGTIYLNT